MIYCASGLKSIRPPRVQERFRFGKYKGLQQEEQGTSFNGRRIQQSSDFTISVDMCKFVTERLSEVRLARGRKSEPDSPATDDERRQTSVAIGSLAWCAKEARPDAAAGASILASRRGKLTGPEQAGPHVDLLPDPFGSPALRSGY